MAKLESYTVDNLARSGDAAVIKEAAASVKNAQRGTRARMGLIMVAAAYTVVAALRAKVYTKSDLSTMWGPEDAPKQMLSTITLYDRLGICAVDMNVTPEGPVWDHATARNKRPLTVWMLLASKSGATISEVGQYIEKGAPSKFDRDGKVTERDGNPDLDGLQDLLQDYFTPAGEKKSSDDRARAAAQRRIKQMEALNMSIPQSLTDAAAESTDGGEGGNGVPATRNNDVKFKTALGDVARLASEITSEQWNSKDVQDLLGLASKALREKTEFEAKAKTAPAKKTAAKRTAKKAS